MYEICFQYNQKERVLNWEGKDLVRDVFGYFANSFSIKLENLVFIHEQNNNQIIFEVDDSLIEQKFNLLNGEKRITLKVF